MDSFVHLFGFLPFKELKKNENYPTNPPTDQLFKRGAKG
jgi:hypothetical protein